MSEFKIQKAEGSYKLEDMQKRASVASTADGLTLEGPNFKLGCLTACPDMLLFACEELAKANQLVAELEKLNNNQSKTIEAMEGVIASEIAMAFEKASIPLRAKAGCIGEFNFIIEDAICCPQCWEEKSDDCDMCNGKSGETGLSDLTATVPWDLCKDIWLRMNKFYAEQLREEQG